MYTNKEAKKVNQLAREQLKHKLLADILLDLTICDIEGWDKKEYIQELHYILSEITSKL